MSEQSALQLKALADRSDEVNFDAVHCIRTLKAHGHLKIDSKRVADRLIAQTRENFKENNDGDLIPKF